MKSWLFALGLALCCAVQADDLMRFEAANISQMKGPWYGAAMTTNCLQMREMAQHMPVIPAKIDSVAEEEFKMKMSMRMPKGCKVLNPTFKKENGVYTSTCERGGKKILDLLKTDYATYTFTSMKMTHDGKNFCTVVACMSKELPVNEAFLSNCRDFSGRVGLDENSLHKNRIEGMCDPPQ